MTPELIGMILGSIGILLLFLVFRTVLSSVRKKLETAVRERFHKKDIIGATLRANFFGEKSKGGKQVRGNGALILTKDILCFIRAVPEKEFVIPVGSIKEISLPKAFNGKSVLAPLLCVHYTDDDREDAMAWAIKEPDKWKKVIEAVVAENRRPE